MSKAPATEPVTITPELKAFCRGIVDLYETYLPTDRNATVDWWYGFAVDVDVNLCIEDGRLQVHAYRYDDSLDTRSGVTVVDRRLRRRKK